MTNKNMTKKFTFKVIDGVFHEYNSDGKLIHVKHPDGYEYWGEYNSKGNLIRVKHPKGVEYWRDYNSEGL